jgi:hypothetical protein
MSNLDVEIAAYGAKREELEASHMGKWVLVHERELIGIFDSFQAAAEDAVRKFGRGPYLIRQVPLPPLAYPRQ